MSTDPINGPHGPTAKTERAPVVAKDSDLLANNGPSLTDNFQANVWIPVTVKAGKIVEFHRAALPKLDDCVGDLVVPAFAIKDEEDLKRLTEERVETLFGAETVLYCRVGWKHVPVGRRSSCKRARVANAAIDASFVEIVLEEALQVRRRRGRKSSLESVRCHIPTLKKHADSLNEAYRVISEVFEPTRRSYGGNVFLNVYFFDRTKGLCRPLDELRGGVPFVPR